MKTCLTTLLMTLLLCFFLPNKLQAQIATIDSLAISPNNPTITDTVKAIIHSYHSSSSCELLSSSIDIDNDTINIEAYHAYGILPATCSSIDTLNIGILNAKTYQLIYCLVDTVIPQTYDCDTITFTVNQSTAIQNTKPKEQIRIHPNPSHSQINIDLTKLAAGSREVQIYSALGQKIKQIQSSKKSISLDLNSLVSGIYVILITDEHERQWAKKIIKF